MLLIAIDTNGHDSTGAEPAPFDASIARLWSACEPVVDNIARRTYGTGRALDVADVVQQAALTVVELLRSGRYSPEPTAESLDALKREVAWRVRDFLRAERRRQGRSTTADDLALERALARHASVSPSAGLTGRALTRAVNSLSPRQRAVVAGLYFRDAKVAELATELEVSPQAITALHRRALVAMRHGLSGPDVRSSSESSGGEPDH